MKNKIILISSIAFFLITCRNDKGQLPVPVVQAGGECSTPHTYTDIIAPMITTYCTNQSGCHGNNAPQGIPYVTYAGLKYDVDNGKINDRIILGNGAIMPPANSTAGPLSASQKSLLKCWIADGALNSGPVPAACSTPISYANTIAPLISTTYRCSQSGCHSGTTGVTYGDYTTYAGLNIDATNGKLDSIVLLKKSIHYPINHDSIIQIISTTDVSNIDCWIKQGALNN